VEAIYELPGNTTRIKEVRFSKPRLKIIA